YTPYPTDVSNAFIAEAAATGIDIFRIFDALNNVDRMRPAIDAVRATGTAVAEAALAYTGDLADPAEDLYTLDYYLRIAERLVAAGAHVLAVKDMAGLLRPAAATRLVGALVQEFDVPVHVHTHDTAGGQLATYLAAAAAGASAVDGAAAPLAGTTSQPSLSAIVAATAHTDRDTGIDLAAVCALEPYWEALRGVYKPFEAGLPAPTGRVYTHEIPGGQLSNLRTQAVALGLGDRFEDIETAYADVDRMLGRLIKVTPSSKVVGDLALALVGAGATAADFAADPRSFDIPDSVTGFFRGDLGEPAGGWPAPLRTAVLGGRRAAPEQAAAITAGQRDALEGGSAGRRAMLDELLFPGPARGLAEHRAAYGDTSVLPSAEFFYGLTPGVEHRIELEPGKTLIVGLESISEPDERGMRSVMCTLNGQLRPVEVRDRGVEDTRPRAEKADRTVAGHVPAPFAGVVTLAVAAGDRLAVGDVVGSIEAMKMEAAITAPVAGTVARTAITQVAQVEGGDLLVEIEP
ncbi:biotin/lipoyl-containing protein, partial [Tomitella gaofuii]|uniref:biotin/lipoyl-containing protein n=1 Tax=Tomitella gaofuii TaxID=2760083 RepID=UPI002E2C9EB1